MAHCIFITSMDFDLDNQLWISQLNQGRKNKENNTNKQT